MKSFSKNKTMLAAVITIAAVLIVALVSHFAGFNPVNRIVKLVVSPFQTGVAYISGKITSTVDFLWEMKGYKNTNEELLSENAELKTQNRDIAQYREENERLKELLELKDENTVYSTVAATIIGYDSDSPYGKLEISKGSANGIAVGNTVITSEGVVGIVTEVGLTWATVTSILENGTAMGVKVVRTGDAAVAEGDSELAKDIICKMTFVDDSANIIVGDVIETSGSGGIYPPGLQVGIIQDIKSDNMGQIDYASIKPSVDFKTLHEVLVINGMN